MVGMASGCGNGEEQGSAAAGNLEGRANEGHVVEENGAERNKAPWPTRQVNRSRKARGCDMLTILLTNMLVALAQVTLRDGPCRLTIFALTPLRPRCRSPANAWPPQAMLLLQTDITARALMEKRMSTLTETQVQTGTGGGGHACMETTGADRSRGAQGHACVETQVRTEAWKQ